MTCSSVFWEWKWENLKTVSPNFFQVAVHSNQVHLWTETLLDSLSTLGCQFTTNKQCL